MKIFPPTQKEANVCGEEISGFADAKRELVVEGIMTQKLKYEMVMKLSLRRMLCGQVDALR